MRLVILDISPINASPNKKLSYYGSIEEHRRLLTLGRAIAAELVKDSRIKLPAAPILLHPDVHKRNIYVSADDLLPSQI